MKNNINKSNKVPLLPSNFLLYARCVSSLLKKVLKHQEKSNSEGKRAKIKISTFFKGSIDRWFNVSYISGAKFWFTPEWWYNGKNGYLDDIRKISLENKTDFIIRRIIGVPKNDILKGKQIDPRNVIIKYTNKKPEFLKVVDLMKTVTPLQDKIYLKNIELLDSIVPKRLNLLQGNTQVTPLGYIQDKMSIPKGWQSAVTFFENNFHNTNNHHDGVLLKYCDRIEMEEDSTEYLSKDDLFIVEIKYGDGTDGKPFGIIFNQDDETDTSGIKPIDYSGICDALTEFDKFWFNGKNTLNEILK